MEKSAGLSPYLAAQTSKDTLLDAADIATQHAPEAALYRDALVVLVTAALIVPLLQRLNINTILGFLLAGAVLGPKGLGGLSAAAPWISWVTVTGDEGLGLLGERILVRLA